MTLFLGRLPQDIQVADLEDIFQKYGKISRLDIKRGTSYNFGFLEFQDKRDAEDALRATDGQTLSDFGTKLVVEWSKGVGRRGDKNGCFNCGQEGHIARDCRERDSI
ncbi:hypothetical protein BC829DRAFT_84524 [Chytridium lagenaria]|nr:hypothetical protein BC829DRAFT_84524 [Chytridium lagenaria]